MNSQTKQQIIEAVAHKLDITPQMYQHAIRVVSGLTAYINNSDNKARIFKQGSFRLGTIIKPCKKDTFGDYDVDMVVEYNIQKDEVSPEDIKNKLGDCLSKSPYSRYLDDEGAKCWTLNYVYEDKDRVDFHIDLLPCVPESIKEKQSINPQEYRDTAIAITKVKDKKAESYTYSWDASNPDGYAMWFDRINYKKYSQLKKNDRQRIYQANKQLFESIDKITDEYTRSPLQMVIQILKRHRDVMYLNSDVSEYKPISIIITTLVGKIVEENDLVQNNTYTLLENILLGLEYYSSLETPGITSDFAEEFKTKKLISKRMIDGKPYWRIANPANSKENLANKWNNSSQYAKEFFRWVKQAKSDLINILESPLKTIKERFKKCLGEDISEIFEENNFEMAPAPKPIPTSVNLPQPYSK